MMWMSGVYVNLPGNLLREMGKHKMISWDEVVRKELTLAVSERALVEQTLKKSRLRTEDAEEISRMVKKSLYQRHYEKA
ncbi:MAG: hypothetical protein V1744_01595 [Candidatus Altiarchaeota archaeon]